MGLAFIRGRRQGRVEPGGVLQKLATQLAASPGKGAGRAADEREAPERGGAPSGKQGDESGRACNERSLPPRRGKKPSSKCGRGMCRGRVQSNSGGAGRVQPAGGGACKRFRAQAASHL